MQYFHSQAKPNRTQSEQVIQTKGGMIQTKGSLINLPPCEIKSILDHVYENRLHRTQDFLVLRGRLAHAYGAQEVQKVWRVLMHLLEREECF